MTELINIKTTMTSREIAEVVGKQHFHVLEAIRKMEPAWEKVCKSKFRVTYNNVQMPNGGIREEPQYELTKTECLYVATKFNDEARAKLVIRWEELETNHTKMVNAQLKRADESARRRWLLSNEKKRLNAQITNDMKRLKDVNRELNQINFDDFTRLSFSAPDGEPGRIPFRFPNRGKMIQIS